MLDICADIDENLPKSIEEVDDSDTVSKGSRVLPHYSLKSLILKESATDIRIKQKDRLCKDLNNQVLRKNAI